jgi:hypothetical protein
MEKELLTLPEHLSSPLVFSGVRGKVREKNLPFLVWNELMKSFNGSTMAKYLIMA